MLKKLVVVLVLVSANSSLAQLSITNGDHNLEISGLISSYYNYRVLDSGYYDKSSNRFKLRDAQIQLEGRYKNTFEYEFQIDFADLIAGATGGGFDAENPGLMDAYVVYKGIPFLSIKAGYGKNPYSRTSNVPFMYSPYWQRPEMCRGDLFSRRDIGVTLMSSFWKQRIDLIAGMYNGLGEISLGGKNDASGTPEFIGRAQFAYPSRYRFQDIDTRITPIPMFVIGANGRYTNKVLPAGEYFPTGSQGPYLMKVISGQKTGYGIDFSCQYMGFSAQFEIQQFIMRPDNEASVLFRGTDKDFNKGYVRSGGYYGQLNYFHKKMKTIFSVRYESFNINDLADGELQRVSGAIAYQIKGFDAMVKAQYFHNLKAETDVDPLGWSDQFRVGFQYAFK